MAHISPDLGYTNVSNKVYIGTALYGPQDAHHLAARNICTVLCLLTANELAALDIDLQRLQQEAAFAGINHVHMPTEKNGYAAPRRVF